MLPHKELRFLVPCLPLAATVAGLGFERIMRWLPAQRLLPIGAALATSVVFGYRLTNLQFEDMGQYLGTPRASQSVWKHEQEPTLLLAAAGERPDLCGVAVLGARAGFTGGFTYLHRDVPLMYQGELCDMGAVNYVIASTNSANRTLPAGYQLEVQNGAWGLFRREGVCRPPLREDDRLLEGARDMGLGLRQAKQSSDGSLSIDLERDAGAFVQNWGHGELLDCDMARWATGKQAAVEFDFSPADRQYELSLRVRPHHDAWPQVLSVAINGQRQRVAHMSRGIRTYSVDVPPDALRAGRNRLEFLFSRSSPAGGNDQRNLTALFRAIELRPKHDDFSIDVALAESRQHLVRGFQAPEQEAGMTYAWSDGPSSVVEGSLASPRSPYVLQTLAESVPFITSQQTRVFANDQLVGTLAFTAKWEAQRLLIPAAALRLGRNTIRFEYEASVKPSAVNPAFRDDRQLAVRFRQIQLLPLAASDRLDVGTPSARTALIDGWSRDERDGERTAVWTDGPRASVLLSLAGVSKPILRLNAIGYQHALPNAVGVSINGERVGAFSAPDGWQSVAVPLPSRKYAATGDLIEFTFDHTRRPSEHDPNSSDHRRLALRVDRIWIESDASAVLSASVQASQTDPAGTQAGVAVSH